MLGAQRFRTISRRLSVVLLGTLLAACSSPSPVNSVGSPVAASAGQTVSSTPLSRTSDTPLASPTATPDLQATIVAAVRATLTAQPAPTVAPTPPPASPTPLTASSLILGKWEIARAGTGGQIAETYEFFGDGTVARGSAAGKYTWIDGNRLKLDYGLGSSLFAVKVNGNQMDWTDSAGIITELIRYQDLDPTDQSLVGTWQLQSSDTFASLDATNCIGAFDKEIQNLQDIAGGLTIDEITFATGETFLIPNPFHNGKDARGTYAVQGRHLKLGAVSVGSNFAPRNTGLDCEILTLSHMRLTLKNDSAPSPFVYIRRVS